MRTPAGARALAPDHHDALEQVSNTSAQAGAGLEPGRAERNGASPGPLTDDVYTQYRGELLGFAAKALGDPATAEDVVQETFVRAWRAGQRYDPTRASIRTWLFSIARNTVVDVLRRNSSRPPLASTEDQDHAAEELAEPVDRVDRLLTGMQLEEGLRRLTPQHRQVVWEVHVRGRTCADLAAEFSLPPSTVRSRLVYGVRALRAALEEGGWLA